MTDELVITEDGGVLSATLSRPQKLNAITSSMQQSLREAVERLEEASHLRVLVITAVGRFFTAGLDISEFVADPEEVATTIRRRQKRLHSLYDAFEETEKIVIASVQGPAVGAGLEMAVSCDLRLVSADATFSLPELRDFGVIPASGGISRLTRLVGPAWATWIALAGQTVSAPQALAIGLAHEICPPATLAARSLELAHELARLDPEAVSVAKLAIGACADLGRDRGRDIERLAGAPLLANPEFIERVASFQRNSSAAP